jgi:predicted TIM-barrel fold metal-dependent hydrolase
LCDVDWAIRELEWALSRDARVIVMRPAAPTTVTGQRSPADPEFDPFWARVNEAGITTVVHAGDSGYSSQGYAKDGFAATFEGAGRPSIKMLAIERAAYDFLLTVTFENLFERFPNLRMASVENGSEFLPDLFRKLTSTNRKMPGYFRDDPADAFREHVWINPFWEDDVYEVVDLMGDDRVIFGSDWPHIEGMPEPLDYVAELKELEDDARRRVLRDNALELNALRPT